MLFLLPFGKAVEDRMGHVLFALFYLGSGALGGLVHTLFYINPVVGASGSVCAVVTAFVVLAPKTNIKILLIFFIIGVYSIPSLLLVAFYVAFDTFSLLASFAGANAEPTAWLVHLIGYLTGFIFTISALSLGLISSSEFDVTNMIRQAYRRESFKKAIQTSPILLKNEEEVNEPEFLVRTSIAEAASSGNTKRATEQYFKAIEDYPKIKIDPRSFHIIGSSLLQENKIEQGALVFERYLTQYKNAKDKGEVALLLVAKYTRDLNNPSRAKALLKKYKSDFSEQHQQLASTMSKELQL
jgi:hypothetical protein